MAEVKFRTGLEEFDARLNEVPSLARLFDTVNTNQQNLKARTQNAQPIITTTSIDVVPYIDLDDQMTYDVIPYADLDKGRILLSDFVVRQVWKTVETKPVMSWEDEDGKTLVNNLGTKTAGLAYVADTYRIIHSIKPTRQ